MSSIASLEAVDPLNLTVWCLGKSMAAVQSEHDTTAQEKQAQSTNENDGLLLTSTHTVRCGWVTIAMPYLGWKQKPTVGASEARGWT